MEWMAIAVFAAGVGITYELQLLRTQQRDQMARLIAAITDRATAQALERQRLRA